jgi:tRNA(fMet)-specific endonuclease VapC
MPFLLDTDTVIAVLNGTGSRTAKRLRRERPGDVSVSAVVLHELFHGAFRSARADRDLARVDGLRFEVVEFDKEDAREAGEVRAFLAGRGTPIGPFDTLIAGQARARGLVLVTRNTGEFGRMPRLRMEDWEAGGGV